MWTVVYMAYDENIVKSICAMLRQNKILVNIRETKQDTEDTNSCYEILVPDAEVSQSQELIFEREIN